MSNEDMSELFAKFNDMMKNGNIPDNVKDIFSSVSSRENGNAGNFNDGFSENGSSDYSSYENGSNSNDNPSDFSSIDFETLLKFKSIMDCMRQNKNDPRANLLLSLKPYLKESRRSKVDEYIKYIGMAKAFEAFNNMNMGGEAKK